MSYQCLDCSYQGSRFPKGVCPGCGSGRVSRTTREPGQRPTARKPYLLLFCIALWLYLIVEIYRNLS